MESSQNVHRSRPYIVKKSVFPMKKWTKADRVNKNHVNEFSVDEDDGFFLDDLVGERWL